MRTATASILLSLALLLICCGPAPVDRDESSGIALLTPALIKSTIDVLASDAMMGRNTPSRELDSAAAYIAGRFRAAGVSTVNGSYFQRVPLSIISLGDSNSLVIAGERGSRTFQIKTDFVPFEMTANRRATGEIVFAGYGISAPEAGYDDYKGIDARGKVVLVLRHYPREDDSSSLFSRMPGGGEASMQRKVAAAIRHGATALLVASDPLNHTSLTPRGFPWPSLSRTIPPEALPLSLSDDEADKIPVVHVGPAVVESLLGGVDSLKALQASIDRDMSPRSFALRARAEVRTSTNVKDMSARNVVGLIPGADPAARGQIVVVGAHYDHVGFMKEHREGEDYIYNGADDNASGTAAAVGIAEAFARARVRPARTLLFILFAGEERGLFGSESYVRHPLFPLDSTVAMLNMDMIGRNAPDTLYLVGASRNPELAQVAGQENVHEGFILQSTMEQYLGRSDQAPFLRKGIPILFFHTGEHADYHKVTDSPDKIDNVKAARVARLVFRTASHVASDRRRYPVLAKSVSLF